jgi:glucosamine--fructose-6-phosphate aminotransferase (isomerizing)
LFNKLYKGDILASAMEVCSRLRGSYAIAVMCSEHPNLILAVSKDSPLITGKGKKGGYLASDMNALQGSADEVSILSDGDIAVITPNLIAFYDKSGNSIKKKKIDISALIRSGSSSNYASHMLSEMYEIPRAVSDTINYYKEKGLPEGLQEQLEKIHRVTIVACGTAHNAGMAGKYMLERLIGVPVNVEYASEFRYGNPVLTPDTLIVAISQSGETADTIAAVRLASGKGVKVLSIVNVQGSTLTRCSDYVMPTIAGAEIAVAATKSYNCQITTLSMLAALWSKNSEFLREIDMLPELTKNSLERSAGNELPYSMFNLAEQVFFIGHYCWGYSGSFSWAWAAPVPPDRIP